MFLQGPTVANHGWLEPDEVPSKFLTFCASMIYSYLPLPREDKGREKRGPGHWLLLEVQAAALRALPLLTL